MIRDPSDGSVKETEVARGLGPGSTTASSRSQRPSDRDGPVIDTSTSGLPITKAKAEYLARLEESRKWLESYVRPTI